MKSILLERSGDCAAETRAVNDIACRAVTATLYGHKEQAHNMMSVVQCTGLGVPTY